MIVARVHLRIANRLDDLLRHLGRRENLPVATFEASLGDAQKQMLRSLDRHCERSEAIHSIRDNRGWVSLGTCAAGVAVFAAEELAPAVDCFASLAMTVVDWSRRLTYFAASH